MRPRARCSSAIWICCSDSESKRGSRFVEKENRRVLQERASDRDPLLLAPGEEAALVAHDGFVAERLRDDEFVRVSGFGGGVDFLGRGIEPAKLDVLKDRVVKQEGVLRDQSDLRAQRKLGQRPQILAVDPHHAGGRIVKTQNERKDGALARAACAHEGKTLAGLDRAG